MKHLILFDVDGVLFDVSGSYRSVIIRTVEYYLKNILGFKLPRGHIVCEKDIDALKYFGGFNDDWDLTAGLLYYYLDLLNLPSGVLLKRSNDLEVNLHQLSRWKKEFRVSAVPERIQTRRLQNFIKNIPCRHRGLDAIIRSVGNKAKNLVFYGGKLESTNIVRRIFQEAYLGRKCFRRAYGLTSKFIKSNGAYLKERPLIPKTVFKKLREQGHTLGLVTGRPRSELTPTMDRFQMDRYFSVIVPVDVVWKEEKKKYQRTGRKISLTKPNPFSLVYAIQAAKGRFDSVFYVGDQPDDIRAARNVRKRYPKVIAVGYVPDKDRARIQQLKKAGASVVANHARSLFEILS